MTTMTEGTFQDQIQWLVRKNTPLNGTEVLGGTPADKRISGITVLGPFLTDQVREMLRSGMLEADDEICPENSYWFGLHELAEVKRFLGLDQVVVARTASADEERTQPDLETTQPDFLPSADDKTPPGLDLEGEASATDPEATAILTRPPAKPAAANAPATTAAATAPAATPAQAKPQAKAPSQAQAQPKPKPAPQKAPTAAELAKQFQRVSPQSPSVYSNPEGEGRAPTILGFEKGQLLGLLIIAGIILAVIGVIWVLKSFRS